MSAIKDITAIILSLLIPIMMIIGPLVILSQSYSFYAYEFNRINVLEEIKLEATPQEVSKVMVDFIKGKTDEFQMVAKVNGTKKNLFNNKEQFHMEDVRNLIYCGNIICLIGSTLILSLYVLLIKLKQTTILRKAYKWSVGVYIALLVGMVIMSISNFNKGFNLFHEVLFTNDLWILNPNKDILLMIMPLEFFIDAFKIAMALSTTAMIVLGVITWIMTRRRNGYLT